MPFLFNRGATMTKVKKAKPVAFNTRTFLYPTGMARKALEYQRKATIFAQGDPSTHVMYVQKGAVKFSVVNEVGKEAIIAMLGAGDFFGEGCLAGQKICQGTATAITHATVLAIEKGEMQQVLHREHAFSDHFIKYMLSRNIQVEEDLIDQLFNSTEKRLARTLLQLARYGKKDEPHKALATISQETLAEMVGTTRPRVNFFMNKFKKQGFIRTDGGLQVNNSLLTVLLHD
jgi:CRP/FNR family transcriptional regulator, cyclic AMP receptor protein